MAGKSTNVAEQMPVVSQAMVVQALKAMTSKVCAPGFSMIPADEAEHDIALLVKALPENHQHKAVCLGLNGELDAFQEELHWLCTTYFQEEGSLFAGLPVWANSQRTCFLHATRISKFWRFGGAIGSGTTYLQSVEPCSEGVKTPPIGGWALATGDAVPELLLTDATVWNGLVVEQFDLLRSQLAAQFTAPLVDEPRDKASAYPRQAGGATAKHQSHKAEKGDWSGQSSKSAEKGDWSGEHRKSAKSDWSGWSRKSDWKGSDWSSSRTAGAIGAVAQASKHEGPILATRGLLMRVALNHLPKQATVLYIAHVHHLFATFFMNFIESIFLLNQIKCLAF